MASTTSIIKLVGISMIVPGVGVSLLVAGVLHPDTGRVIDAGVEAGSRRAAGLGRAAVRQAGRVCNRAYQQAQHPVTPATEPPRASEHGFAF